MPALSWIQRFDSFRPLLSFQNLEGYVTSAGRSGRVRSQKIDASISRYKWVVGDTLKSRDGARRLAEAAIAIKSLKRMSKLGQASFVRVV